MHAQIQIFCQRGGGGESMPNGEKTALIFLCLFWVFLVQNFPGMRGGVQLSTRGGPNTIQYNTIQNLFIIVGDTNSITFISYDLLFVSPTIINKFCPNANFYRI